jgi:hypothetical protein
VNGQAQGVVGVQHRGGEGAWSMEQLMNDVQHRGGGGSRLLELGATTDLGSRNSTHSSLQAMSQRRGGSQREAGGGGEWGEVVQREAGRPAIEAGRPTQGKDDTDDDTRP